MWETKNTFERHPKATLAAIFALTALLLLLATELFLGAFSGLGNPPLYEVSPLYGYRLKPNQFIAPKGGMGFLFGARVTTNNLGLRAAQPWDAKTQDKVLFLGDSVTYGGQYVSDEDLFSSIAARDVPGYKIGNGGINAWGVENIHGLVVDHGFNPARYYVTCLIEGDFYRGLTRINGLPYWSHRPSSALYDLLMFFMTTAGWKRYDAVVDFRADTEEGGKVVDRAVRRLKEMDRYLTLKGMVHLVYILPNREQVLGNEKIDDRVADALSRNGVRASYLLHKLKAKSYDAATMRGWFHDGVHLEPVGHMVYGRLIGEDLRTLLPPVDQAK